MRNNAVFKLLAVVFWLLVWQLGSMLIDEEILLVSPLKTCKTMLEMMGTSSFYRAVAGSFGRIMLGFLLGSVAGVTLAAVSKAVHSVRILLQPPMYAVKATPVASFVILALVWISSAHLSVFISFLMVLPIVYTNVLAGLDDANIRLLEMAKVFRMSKWSVIRAIYIPAAFPMLLTAAKLSLGMCWKAGIAAEVIGQPRGSIGSALQQAKLFFNTPELFAWTLAVILLSVAFEKLVMVAIRVIMRAVKGGTEG